jgi:hypothetical protein
MFAGLAMAGALRPFTGRLEPLAYKPINATPVIAQALADGYAAFRAAQGGLPAGRHAAEA